MEIKQPPASHWRVKRSVKMADSNLLLHPLRFCICGETQKLNEPPVASELLRSAALKATWWKCKAKQPPPPPEDLKTRRPKLPRVQSSSWWFFPELLCSRFWKLPNVSAVTGPRPRTTGSIRLLHRSASPRFPAGGGRDLY